VGLQVIGVELLDRGRHPTVERLAAVRRNLAERNFPDRVVTELETVADSVDHAFPHELLDARGGLELSNRRGTLEQREVELATDGRGGGYDLARPWAQPLQSPRDDFPNSSRQREATVHRRDFPRLERPHALHHHERIALADEPYLIGESNRRRCVDVPARHRADQRRRVGS
jgi:hypothetical protein